MSKRNKNKRRVPSPIQQKCSSDENIVQEAVSEIDESTKLKVHFENLKEENEALRKENESLKMVQEMYQKEKDTLSKKCLKLEAENKRQNEKILELLTICSDKQPDHGKKGLAEDTVDQAESCPDSWEEAAAVPTVSLKDWPAPLDCDLPIENSRASMSESYQEKSDKRSPYNPRNVWEGHQNGSTGSRMYSNERKQYRWDTGRGYGGKRENQRVPWHEQRQETTFTYRRSNDAPRKHNSRNDHKTKNSGTHEVDLPDHQNALKEEGPACPEDAPETSVCDKDESSSCTNTYWHDERGGERNSYGMGRGRRSDEWKTRGPREISLPNKKVVEVNGDLFTAPSEHSMAHCVAADLRMGSGIAVQFRQQFKRVDELLGQRKKVGEVAVLEDNGRYIYYLITKKHSTGKPIMNDFQDALRDMKIHVQKNNVKNIAIPRLGCGLDRLHWKEVRYTLGNIFQDIDAIFTAYNFTEEKEKDTIKKSSIFIVDKVMKLTDLEKDTLLVFFGSEDGYVDEAMTEANEKFLFIQDYKQSPRKTGEVLQFSKRNEIICILIVKKHESEGISYSALNDCLYKLRKIYIKEKFQYMGFTAFMDGNDDLTVAKIVTLLKNVFANSYGEVWICWPAGLQYIYDERNPHLKTDQIAFSY